MTEPQRSAPEIGRLPSSVSDPDVVAFVRIFGLTEPPVYLAHNDVGYGPEWCHVSTKDRALKHGGRRVHGWAIWQFTGVAIADFHSIWETEEGELVDVTPPKFGGDRVLFVRDDTCKIEEENGMYLLCVNRSSNPQSPFYWQGKPTEFSHWQLSPTNPHLVAYCQELNFPVSSILTEDGRG